MAVSNRCEVIILGVLGCGAIRNAPIIVAKVAEKNLDYLNASDIKRVEAANAISTLSLIVLFFYFSFFN